MSNYKYADKYQSTAGYIDKEQLFWTVFGVGNEVKIITSKLPAGLPYDDRLKIMNQMKRHVKSIGGKSLRTGFWNLTPYPPVLETLSADIVEEDALPWD